MDTGASGLPEGGDWGGRLSRGETEQRCLSAVTGGGISELSGEGDGEAGGVSELQGEVIQGGHLNFQWWKREYLLTSG